MRWFKHLSMAHDDVGLATLLETMGPEAYGIYWLLLEHFASVMEKDCKAVPELVRSDIQWAKICRSSSRKFRKFAQTATELRLICAETAPELRQFSSRRSAKRLLIRIPKLLKYRDEYSRKSGHTPDNTPDKLPARVDRDTDTDTEKDLKTLAQSDKSLHATGPPPPVVLVEPPSREPILGTIPLVDGTKFGFTQADVSGWCEAYPAVDVMQQLRKMREWAKANPKKAKTKSGIRRYVNNWLAQEQDKGGNNGFHSGRSEQPNQQRFETLDERTRRIADAAKRGEPDPHHRPAN